MGYVQVFGVFMAAFFGINIMARAVHTGNQEVKSIHMFAFAIGCAMVACGVFL